MSTAENPAEGEWLDEDAGPVVRPYAMTRGRTRPSQGEFDLVSLVLATRAVSTQDSGLGPEHLAIMNTCVRPLSVAEVAALVDLPVGIVRVLLGDLLGRNLILVREPLGAHGMPSEGIFEAVLNGLRAL